MEKSSQNINRVKSSQPSNKESSSRNTTNIPQEYFNSNRPTADQASQRQYFSEVLSDPNNNQPSQPVEPNYLDQGIPGYNKNRSRDDAFQTSSNSNNPISDILTSWILNCPQFHKLASN